MLQVWFSGDKLNAGVHCLSNCKIAYFVSTWDILSLGLWLQSEKPVHACLWFSFSLMYTAYCSLLGKLPRLPCRNNTVNDVKARRIDM